MLRSRSPLGFASALVLVLALALAAAASASARHPYLLHLKIEGSKPGKSVDVALPWTRGHGGSPFDFSVDHDSDLSVERLRWAWTALQRLPEGETVTITRDGEKTRLSRRAGFLVIEPQPPGDHDHARVRIPGEIVEIVIRRNGRFDDRDVESLLARRDRIDLVRVDSDDARVHVWIGREDDSID